MKIQEALSKVKELKGDAFTLLGEAQHKKEKVIYLNLKDQYSDKDAETSLVDGLIENALSKLAYAHDLKLAIQKANTLVGITDLIQEMDFLKMVCQWIEPFTKIEKESEPTLSNDYRTNTTEAIFIKRLANFNIEDIITLYDKAVDRIRVIELELQRKNWDVDIEEVYKESCMGLLDKLTT
jgi:hypothetical protein